MSLIHRHVFGHAHECIHTEIYGLIDPLPPAAVVYTTNISRALRVSSALETGGVAVNSPALPELQVPFGGVKQSGTGRELGEEGLKAYLEPKTICIK